VGIFGEDVYLSSQMGVATVEGFEKRCRFKIYLSGSST
jgi:beta-glucosidase-like glycosyl hydrolase